MRNKTLALALAAALAWLAPALRAEETVEGSSDPLPSHWTAAQPIGTHVGPVTEDMLRNAAVTTEQWLAYAGNQRNFRHTPITALTPDSVRQLHVAWAMPTGTVGQFAASPIVYGGIMYVTSSYNRVFALDARTGQMLWRYDYQNASDLRLCCGPANRGVSISGDLLLMGTLDAHLVALDRRTGEVVWNTTVADHTKGYSITSAPLIAGDRAVIGVGGGEYGVRGFFDAYDVKTGRQLWRHWTVPAKGEPGAETWSGTSNETGGAPTWTYGAFDAGTNTLFWTTGNPSPDWDGSNRAGDNLYSDSLLALDPATGRMKWYFQFTPHDVWDYDGNTQLFLIDTTFEGKERKLIVQPNRNGYFYVLDRTNGKFLRATQYLEQLNWGTIDAKGRPVVNPAALPSADTTFRTCPSALGGMNGSVTGAFNPDLGLVFAPTIEACNVFTNGISAYSPGLPFTGGQPDSVDANTGKAYGNVVAVDVASGQVKWRHREALPILAGTLSTAGGVVFTGTMSGDVLALDSATGEVAWRFHAGGGVRGQPVAYQLDGRTYVAVPTGSFSTLDSFAGGHTMTPEGGTLFVFALPSP